MNDLGRDWGRTGPASNLLLYEAVKRWKNAGIPIATFIYAYENQVWEKAYCLALRKFYPSAKIIGYQHSTVPKMLLNHFFSKNELPVMPFPDKVITNGKYTESLFIESGYDPYKVVRGGALRFSYLVNKKKTIVARKADNNPIILVALSVEKNETMELLWKTILAFGQITQLKIVLKFHPDCPYRFIAREIGILPKHFIVSDKSTGELLQDSHVLLYTCTATSIEALALGVPILHVKSDFTIDRDNLADFPGVRESVSSPEDISGAAQRLLKMDEKELSGKRQLWAEIVAEMFEPVDESTFDLFL
jgi:surface carbohydrate biosynthesis protein (TIGR04326 family)